MEGGIAGTVTTGAARICFSIGVQGAAHRCILCIYIGSGRPLVGPLTVDASFWRIPRKEYFHNYL
jgi:hypothetical protein